MEKANLEDLTAFITADGSSIRELAGPAWSPARNQSLAEATIEPGGETAEHYHPQAEELYFFVAGEGRLRLGGEESDVTVGDCVVIPPGTPHKLFNPTDRPLVLLCCCAPAYRDDDTVMTGE
ncbi:MAG TPA: cupin domain-containing protein [Solirubrobacteraceae bacterium]|nr:cupin domain-containing protein [Solirubrobacteraceae bacterium]